MPGKEILRAPYAGIRLHRDPAQEVQHTSAPPAPQLIPDQIAGHASHKGEDDSSREIHLPGTS